jgi:hypothetical protein
MKTYSSLITLIFVLSVAILTGCASSSADKKGVSKDEVLVQVEGLLEQYCIQHSEYPKTLSALELSKDQEYLRAQLGTLRYKSFKWGKSVGYDLEDLSRVKNLAD